MNSHFFKQFLALAEKCLSVGHFSLRILITETYPCIPGNICKYVLNNCFLTVFLFLVYNYKIEWHYCLMELLLISIYIVIVKTIEAHSHAYCCISTGLVRYNLHEDVSLMCSIQGQCYDQHKSFRQLSVYFQCPKYMCVRPSESVSPSAKLAS